MADTENEGIVFADMSEDVADAKEPPNLPEGDYIATVASCKPMKKAETGTEYYQIAYRIAPEAYPADFDAEFYPDGKTVVFRTGRVNDDPMGKFNLKKLKEAHGLPGNKSRDPNQFVGTVTKVRVRIDNWQGKKLEKVVSVGQAD